jgi:DNA-binding NarL/FixJ family response regulator
MIKAAIADDHPLMRKGVSAVLDAEVDISVISQASEANELLANIRGEMPDIAIVDITMPGKSGLELLKAINEQFSELPVLILSIHPAVQYAIRCLKAGANGYLNKSSITNELVSAIHCIVKQKRKYITADVATLLADNIDAENGKPLYQSLSDREFTVLCMIASGKNVKSIADELSLSPHTVQTYRARIKDKMHLNSDVDMARYAIHHDLIS